MPSETGRTAERCRGYGRDPPGFQKAVAMVIRLSRCVEEERNVRNRLRTLYWIPDMLLRPIRFDGRGSKNRSSQDRTDGAAE